MKKFKKLLLVTFLAGFLGLTVTACGGGGGGSGAAPPLVIAMSVTCSDGSTAMTADDCPPPMTRLSYKSEHAEYLRQNAPNIPGIEAVDINSNGGSITVIFGPNFTREDFINLLTVLERLADGGVPPAIVMPVTGPDDARPVLVKFCPNGDTVLATADCPTPPIELPDISSPVACADACPSFLAKQNDANVEPTFVWHSGSFGYQIRRRQASGDYFLWNTLPRSEGSRRSYSILGTHIRGNEFRDLPQRSGTLREEAFDVLTNDDYLSWGVWELPREQEQGGFVVGAPLPFDYQLPKSGSATYDGKSEFYLVGRDSQTDAIQQTAGSQTGRVRFIVEFDENDTIMEGFLIQAQNNFQLTFDATTYSNGKFVSDISCGGIGTCNDAPSGGELEAAFFGKGAANGAPTKMGGVFSADGFRRLGDVDNANIVGSFGARLLE